MADPIELAAKVAGTGTQFRVPMPAKQAGDYIQFVFLADKKPSYGFTDAELVLEMTGALYVYQRYVNTTGGATGTSDGYLTRFATATAYSAFCQVAHVAGASNPNQPGGNDALRQALLGAATGAVSGLPWNSGVNPSGRGSGSGAPAGHEYLNDVVEGQRGAPFDTRHSFQYQNRTIGNADSWNDLIGMQNLDWFDRTKPCILGQKPWPKGGTYAAAAAGAYDVQYEAIGATIASKRNQSTDGNVGLRWAWEFNGDWYDHSVGRVPSAAKATEFRTAWRKWYQATKRGAGDAFFSIWSVAMSTQSQAVLETMYPGDDVVDVIGIDLYDMQPPSGRGFHDKATLLSATGLGALIAFARAHGKLIAFDEWGGHATGGYNDGGDNPDFQSIMFEIFNDNRDILAYEAGFNDNDAGNVENNLWLTNGRSVQLPNARARHIQLVRGLVQGGPAFNYTEPPLFNPIIFRAGGSTGYFRVDDPNRDVLVLCDAPVTKSTGSTGITVVGGRNVVIRDAVVHHAVDNSPGSSDSTSNRVVQIQGNGTFNAPSTQPRTVMVNGLVASGVVKDGIIIDLRGDTNVEVILQSVDFRAANTLGQLSGNHSDLVQPWNGPRTLRINRLYGVADYQGLFLQQDMYGADVAYSTYVDNMHVEGLESSAYLLWDNHSTDLHVAEKGPVTVYSRRYGATEQPASIYWDATQGGSGKRRWGAVQYAHREPGEVLDQA